MSKPITAMRYADLKGITIDEVISKIKSGELNGHSRFLSWYVDEVDPDTLQGADNIGEPTAGASGSASSSSPSHPNPAAIAQRNSSDTIADALNVIAWLILGAGMLFALYLLNASPVQSPVAAITTVGASLFQALLLMGFARIINYLKLIAEK